MKTPEQLKNTMNDEEYEYWLALCQQMQHQLVRMKDAASLTIDAADMMFIIKHIEKSL